MSAEFNFSLYKRKESGNWQTQFRNKSRATVIRKSTGTSNKAEALKIVYKWLEEGFPQEKTKCHKPIMDIFTIASLIQEIKIAPLNENDALEILEILKNRGLFAKQEAQEKTLDTLLVDYLKGFWDYDNSIYVKEKMAHGQIISKRHCFESTKRIAYWIELYPELTLKNLSINEITTLSLRLKERGLSPATINKIMLVCSTATAWAKHKGLLINDPFEGAMRFSEHHRKRGILTTEEVTELFTKGKWQDQRARIASLLACTTGLREGECRGMQVQDIFPDHLIVWNWSDIDGRRPPKNGENRIVPLLPEVYNELQTLLDLNPFGNNPYTFVFFSAYQDKPIRPEPLITGLETALESIGISHEDRLKRNIDFHSWRHYYSTTMASIVTSRKLRVVTGHKSPSIFEGYANHATDADIKEVSNAEKNAFATLFRNEVSEWGINTIKDKINNS